MLAGGELSRLHSLWLAAGGEGWASGGLDTEFPSFRENQARLENSRNARSSLSAGCVVGKRLPSGSSVRDDSMHQSRESRGTCRYPIDRPCVVVSNDGTVGGVPGRLTDVSFGGARLEAEFLPELGAPVRFAVPGFATGRLQATVVWRRLGTQALCAGLRMVGAGWPYETFSRLTCAESSDAASSERTTSEDRSTPSFLRELGLDASCTVDEVHQAYRALAKRCHPDKGGDVRTFVSLHRHYSSAQAYLERRSKGNDRRLVRRFPADLSCFYVARDAIETSRARLLDVSREGAAMECDERFRIGHPLRLRIADFGMPMMAATVVRVLPASEGRWMVGVRLSEREWPLEVFSAIAFSKSMA